MHKVTIPQSLHIAWRVYFGATVALQVCAIYNLITIQFALQSASGSEIEAISLGATTITGLSGLVLLVFGIVNTFITVVLYQRHTFTKLWNRTVLTVAALSLATLLIVLGTVINYFIERSTAIQQVESNNDSGKIIPLAQPKSQE